MFYLCPLSVYFVPFYGVTPSSARSSTCRPPSTASSPSTTGARSPSSGAPTQTQSSRRETEGSKRWSQSTSIHRTNAIRQEPDLPATFGIVDLFAGPGGRGEGFASLVNDGHRPFQIGISVEKEASAHRTLTLRAFTTSIDPAAVCEAVRQAEQDWRRRRAGDLRGRRPTNHPLRARRHEGERGAAGASPRSVAPPISLIFSLLAGA